MCVYVYMCVSERTQKSQQIIAKILIRETYSKKLYNFFTLIYKYINLLGSTFTLNAIFLIIPILIYRR